MVMVSDIALKLRLGTLDIGSYAVVLFARFVLYGIAIGINITYCKKNSEGGIYMNFVCPICKSPLLEEGGAARCRHGHSFDRAKAGYYNLLLSSDGKNHGDNRDMVEARRKFLDTGAYRPLADKVSELLAKYLTGKRLLDVGCGEGYYTDIVKRAIPEASVSGFDISRDAVKHAARRNKDIDFAVASAYRMPTADEGFDGVLNMFSPLAREEIHRSLKRGGIFVMVIPGVEHLFGLKRATYKTPYKNEVQDSSLHGFELVDEIKLKYTLNLDTKEKIHSLFMMTPYAYRTGNEERERVLSLENLETDADFVIFVYRKV